MIGAWMKDLTDEQLGRILTGQMEPFVADGGYLDRRDDGDRCLVEVATGLDWREAETSLPSRTITEADNRYANRIFGGPGDDSDEDTWSVIDDYDLACTRFGRDPVNAAIRHRCLRILAARSVPAGDFERATVA